MSAGNLFFALCAAACVGGALATVLAKNPIRGAVGLLTTIVGIAGLFLQLSAQFLAAIQLIVYAGAVVVLFVFVIMLLGPDASGREVGEPKARAARVFGGALMALFGVVGTVLIARSGRGPTRFPGARPEHGSIEAVGQDIFTKAIVPFEIATALLIVAAIGAIAVARSKPVVKQPRPKEVGETRRLFVGPLHPRDAGRPLGEESAS
jgi:NADH-quinone oxidoreductase subunit J